MNRVELLCHLMDEDVVREIKARIGAEGLADLVMEIVNPYRPLTTTQKAKLAGKSERAMRDRSVR